MSLISLIRMLSEGIDSFIENKLTFLKFLVKWAFLLRAALRELDYYGKGIKLS